MRFKWTDQATNQWADGRTTLIWRISIGDASTHLKMRLTKGVKINDILKDKKWADDDDENRYDANFIYEDDGDENDENDDSW